MLSSHVVTTWLFFEVGLDARDLQKANPISNPTKALESKCLLPLAGLYISLNQCSLSSGLKYRSIKRDRLASDEPNVLLISPT
jgi:hypothetical protein